MYPAKFGSGIFSNVITGINTTLGIYGAVGQQQGGGSGGVGGGICRAPSGCFQCKMTGRGDIAGCIDLLIQEFHRVESQGNLSTTLQAAQNGLAALQNPSYFAQNGDAYLEQAKGVLQHEIQLLQSQGVTANTGNTTTVMTNANGQTVQVAGAGVPVIAGVPNKYLLIGAGVVGLGLIYLLKK